MFWNRLFYAAGIMFCAYVLSKAMLSAAKKIEPYSKLRFLMNVFIFIHYISSVASLFIGLFMHFQEEHYNDLQKRVDDLAALQQDYKDKNAFLEEETNQLRNQLSNEQSRTDERSFELGRKQGYCNGYAVGFEDCMDILELDQEHKSTLLPIARRSGIHRIKSRPYMLDTQQAINDNGILK